MLNKHISMYQPCVEKKTISWQVKVKNELLVIERKVEKISNNKLTLRYIFSGSQEFILRKDLKCRLSEFMRKGFPLFSLL